MKVLIWSKKHQAWWRASSQGYTNNIAAAGLYEQEEAQRIVDGSNGKNEMTVSLEKAFTDLQYQAYQTDVILSKIRSKSHDIDTLIRDTKVLERT